MNGSTRKKFGQFSNAPRGKGKNNVCIHEFPRFVFVVSPLAAESSLTMYCCDDCDARSRELRSSLPQSQSIEEEEEEEGEAWAKNFLDRKGRGGKRLTRRGNIGPV